MNVSELN